MWCSSRASWVRVTLVGLACAASVFLVVLFAYQLALARVPQHRATLERLVRAQTGLDVRFSSLGLRWGWYGPEAVFKSVELGEPGRSEVLLRAPELTVGFDAWRTIRSGQLAPGRIALLAPDIDLAAVSSGSRAASGIAGGSRQSAGVARAKILERWRDGRIDIEGGQVRLPDPYGTAEPFSLQIRRASVRRSADEWDLFALVFLPERLGRTARVVMRLDGALDRVDTLSGSLRLEARRVSFAGWRDLRAFAPRFAPYVPVAGGGDVTVNLDFQRGQVVKADGNVHAGGVVFNSAVTSDRTLNLDRVRGQWRIARHGTQWRLAVDALELGIPADDAAASSGSLTVEAGDGGDWFRGKLDRTSLQPLAAIARWMAPHLDFAGARLNGVARNLEFDWNGQRPPGRQLNASVRLEDLSVAGPARGFVLSGMTALISGNEVALAADVESQAAQLELAASPRSALQGVHVAAQLRISRADEGWRIESEGLELLHDRTRLYLTGALAGGGAKLEPELDVRGDLTGADVPFLSRILGSGVATAFGPASLSLTAGKIDKANFELRGPVDAGLMMATGEGFSGSATLRDAVVSGTDPWPDTVGVGVRIEWRDGHVRAVLENGSAGPFQLATATAEWDAQGNQPTRVSGTVTGRLEEAMTWLRRHPGMNDYAPQVQDLDLRGDTRLDFDVTVPQGDHHAEDRTGSVSRVAAGVAPVIPQPISTRVVASFEGAKFSLVAGSIPMEDLAGSLVFEGTRLRRSTLRGSWLGGPVTLRVTERRERGQFALAMQAHGTLDARRLAAVSGIDPTGHFAGAADWSGEATYLPGGDSRPAQWRLQADSTLVGIESRLARPLAKQADERLPLHLELTGSEARADLRLTVGDRLRSLLALERTSDSTWRVAQATANFGAGSARYIGGRGDSESQLQLDSEGLAGVATWSPGGVGGKPIEIRLARLSVPQEAVSADSAGMLLSAMSALGRTVRLSAEDLWWEGRELGHLSALLAPADEGLILDDIRLSGGKHDGSAVVHCQAALALCRAEFTLESSDAAATLADFGFRPDISATQASLSGEVEWKPGSDSPWPALLVGRLRMKLVDGTTRAASGMPFALLAIPALASAVGTQGAAPQAWRFSRLDADFDLRDGQASTADLHFDGDAEILMRGRTGLVARDYDQQVWILKGEERLPAAVRRLGPTPRMAAAWLALRELFVGTAEDDRSRAVLRLQGSWDEPAVVSADR